MELCSRRPRRAGINTRKVSATIERCLFSKLLASPNKLAFRPFFSECPLKISLRSNAHSRAKFFRSLLPANKSKLFSVCSAAARKPKLLTA